MNDSETDDILKTRQRKTLSKSLYINEFLKLWLKYINGISNVYGYLCDAITMA